MFVDEKACHPLANALPQNLRLRLGSIVDKLSRVFAVLFFFLAENSGLFHDKLDTLHLRASLYTILKLTNTPTHRLPPFFKVGQEVHHVHPLKKEDLVGKGPSSSLSLFI